MGVNKIPQIVLGLVWFLASLLLITHGWSMITDIGDLFVCQEVNADAGCTAVGQVQDATFYTLYWIGLFLMIILCAILPPYWLIISAYKES